MFITKKAAAIVTRAYGEIFSYPLTPAEMREWCVYYPIARVPQAPRVNPKLARLRKKRASWSVKKWRIVARVASRLRFIPTVSLIGVTGGLAMNNADRGDDIDLIIITPPHALWMTRAMVTLMLELLNVRRRRGERLVADRICANMYMVAGSLAIPRHERDLYSAHEVLQMVPVFARGGVYKKFLDANSWVKKFLPNAWKSKYKGASMKYIGKKDPIWFSLLLHTSYYILRLLEVPSKQAQLLYMQKNRTTEVISATTLRFHPRDARVWVREALARKLRAHHMPLDKIFFGG